MVHVTRMVLVLGLAAVAGSSVQAQGFAPTGFLAYQSFTGAIEFDLKRAPLTGIEKLKLSTPQVVGKVSQPGKAAPAAGPVVTVPTRANVNIAGPMNDAWKEAIK